MVTTVNILMPVMNNYIDRFDVRLKANEGLFNDACLIPVATAPATHRLSEVAENIVNYYHDNKSFFLNQGAEVLFKALINFLPAQLCSYHFKFIAFSSSGNAILFHKQPSGGFTHSILTQKNKHSLRSFIDRSNELEGYVNAECIALDEIVDGGPLHFAIVSSVVELKALLLVNDDEVSVDEYVKKSLLLSLQRIFEHYFLQKDIVQARLVGDSAQKSSVGMLSTVSHELLTPLNSIIGFSALLNKDPLSSIQKEFISYINTSGQRMLAIVTDLIDVADIEQGRLTWESFRVFLPDILLRNEELLAPAARAKDLDLEIIRHSSVPDDIFCDGKGLQRIIYHLLNSAIVHSVQGKITLQITSPHTDALPRLLEIQVNAPSLGGHMNTIFKNTPGDPAKEHDYHGLNILTAFVQLAGGNITQESHADTGDTCCIQFPFTVSANRQNENKVSLNDNVLWQKHCLVVEDDMQNAKLMLKLLQNESITCDHALHGEQALSFINDNDYDFVLMDLQMPVMDGFETIRKIRQKKGIKATLPVMAITANASPGIRSHCTEAGFDAFLNKPFNPQEFYKMASDMLNLREQDQEVSAVDSGETDNSFSFSSKIFAKVDLTYLRSFSAGDKEFEKEMLSSSLSEIDEKMDKLKSAFSNKNPVKVKELTHSLKSLYCIAGITYLNEIMCTIENEFKHDLVNDGALRLFTSAETIWADSKKELDSIIETY